MTAVQRQRAERKFTAWAIATGDRGNGFLGRYWWFFNRYHPLPESAAGCAVALFETRDAARAL